jgi:hypothetical protein
MMLCKRTLRQVVQKVIANIPYTNTVPFFFTFVAANPVPLVAGQVAQLNPLFQD